MKNILFIVIDCLGYNFLSGEKKLRHKFINSLFSEGTSFSQAFSVASTTTPSMVSMLTGCYPFRHGIMTLSGNYLSKGAPFLPELLRDTGYNTYAEVTGPLLPEVGLSRGFDCYNYRNSSDYYLTSDWGEKLRNKFISGYFKEPWFVLLHFWELHHPRQILPYFNKKIYGVPYERALLSLDHSLKEVLEDILDLSDTIIVLTGDHGEQIERNKFDRILKLSVIKFYDYLNKRGLFENQRLSIYRKYYVGHGYHIIDSLVRVPLLFVHKDKLPQSLELDFQVSHVDVVPTLLSLLGMGNSDLQIDGRSVLSCIEKRKDDSEHAAYMQACGIVLPDQSKWLEGIRYKGFKYVRYQKNKNSDEMLFDLKNDPDERNNIKDKYLIEEMQSKLKELKGKTLQSEDLKMSDDDMKFIADKLKEHGYM